MDQRSIESVLSGLPIGPVRYFDTVVSTNDLALGWADRGAPDLSLVIADEQTAGKGRSGRSWLTPRASALAFSLVLLPVPGDEAAGGLPLLNGIGGLAVASALRSLYALRPEIKWPNDVLVNGKKASGVLTEVGWSGGRRQGAVLGIGVNVLLGSVPPPEMLGFPATCLESELGAKPDRLKILAEILHAFLLWRQRPADEVIRAWEANLAYQGMPVQVSSERGQALRGRIEGLDQSGFLRLRLPSGEVVTAPGGDLSLRLVDSLPE